MQTSNNWEREIGRDLRTGPCAVWLLCVRSVSASESLHRECMRVCALCTHYMHIQPALTGSKIIVHVHYHPLHQRMRTNWPAWSRFIVLLCWLLEAECYGAIFHLRFVINHCLYDCECVFYCLAPLCLAAGTVCSKYGHFRKLLCIYLSNIAPDRADFSYKITVVADEPVDCPRWFRMNLMRCSSIYQMYSIIV